MAGRVTRFALELLVVAAVVMTWRWTPLRESLSLETLGQLHSSPWAPLLVAAAYVFGGMVGLPVTLLIVATCYAFDPLPAALYALGGSLLGAAANYGAARAVGRDVVRRLAGRRLNAITGRLARRGAWAVAVLRLLPIASFPLLSAVAGASRVRLRDFMLGTAIGMIPPILLTLVVVDRVRAALAQPDPVNWGLLGAAAVVIGGVVLLVWRRFGVASYGSGVSRRGRARPGR
jgi:uncharacterized membrane protein YdjX (TVP38/TMEM64 family)